MNHHMKRMIILLSSFLIVISMFFSSVFIKVNADSSYVSSNKLPTGGYSNWAENIDSYIYLEGNYYYRVEYIGSRLIVEKYDLSFNHVSLVKDISLPLSIFGGFFHGDNYNFVVVGDINSNDNRDKEVVRIIKYDNNFNELGHSSIKGANTNEPFAFGSLRMDELNGKLYIHTCHTMYALDGETAHHQANMSYIINQTTMNVDNSYYDVGHPDYAIYSSHSFNQFIRAENGIIYRVDTGDSFPRGIKITKTSSDNFNLLGNTNSALVISGPIGQNATGVSLGGFELSTNNCLIAISKAESYENGLQRNISLVVTNKSSLSSQTITYTNYDNSYGAVIGGPSLTKINSNRFILLWEEYRGGDSTTKYLLVDGNGNPVSSICAEPSIHISSCQPILDPSGNKIVWYYTDNSIPKFYEIDFSNETLPVGRDTEEEITPFVPFEGPQVVEGFVQRLYSLALNRTADAPGLNDWVTKLKRGDLNGASVSMGFLNSQEFLNKGMSNNRFVETLYNIFFNRASDQGGKANWLNALNNGASRQDVIDGFINSTEWANLCLSYGIISGGTGVPTITKTPNQDIYAFSERMYSCCLARSSDPGGIDYWADLLANMRRTGTEVAYGFFFSSEFINANHSNEEYINRLYRTFMGREADPDGFSYWMNRLNTGSSRLDVFYGFAESNEFIEICSSYGIIR